MYVEVSHIHFAAIMHLQNRTCMESLCIVEIETKFDFHNSIFIILLEIKKEENENLHEVHNRFDIKDENKEREKKWEIYFTDNLR